MVNGVFSMVAMTREVVGSGLVVDEDGLLVEEVVAGSELVSVLEDDTVDSVSEMFSLELDSSLFDEEVVEARVVVESESLASDRRLLLQNNSYLQECW